MLTTNSAERFFNRELSWLAFNRRVLAEAQQARKPLVERAKFLAIVSSNLDEFVMVRLAGLRRDRHGSVADPAGLTPEQQFERVSAGMQELVADQYRCWREHVEPALQSQQLHIVDAPQWQEEDRQAMNLFFRQELEPILTPMAVDPTHPFPLVANLSLYVAVHLADAANPDDIGRYALVAVPSGIKRLQQLGADGRYTLVETIVQAHLDVLFPGSRIVEAAAFRVSRDGALDIDEDQATDLLSEIEQGLRLRGQGDPVRLEIDQRVPDHLLAWLMKQLRVTERCGAH